MRFIGTAIGFAALAFTGNPLLAAPPTLTALHPAGGQAGGEAFSVTLTGTTDPWPCKTWCSNPGVTLSTDPEKKAQLNVSITKDAAVGPCLIRIFNAEGASEPRIFVVGSVPEIREHEKTDNDRPSDPQIVHELPAVINGRLEKSQDVDAYQVSLKKGQTLFAHLDGYALRSGIDPFLHLYDPDGNRIALENDNPRNFDPRLEHTVEKDGNYVLAIMAIATPPNANVSFHGAGTAIYRLTVSIDPKFAPPRFDPDFPKEDSPAPKGPLTPPVELFGSISKPGEVDQLSFTGKKSESWLIRVDAFEFGFPTDPVLTLLKEDGSLLRAVDDIKPDVDAEYPYRIGADGVFPFKISDRFGKGGSDFRYRLTIKPSEPDFTVSSDKSTVALEPGKPAEIKLKVTRLNGHKVPLKVETDPLPAGVTFAPPEIPEKSGDVTMKLEAAAGAALANLPFKIRVVESEGESPKSQVAVFSFQDSTARGPYLIEETETLWLTVKPKAEAKPEEKKNSGRP